MSILQAVGVIALLGMGLGVLFGIGCAMTDRRPKVLPPPAPEVVRGHAVGNVVQFRRRA